MLYTIKGIGYLGNKEVNLENLDFELELDLEDYYIDPDEIIGLDGYYDYEIMADDAKEYFIKKLIKEFDDFDFEIVEL